MKEKGNSGFQKFLNGVERVGNKLPHPFTMFMMLTVMIVIIAQLLNGFTVPIPGGKEDAVVNGILNKAGFQWFVNNILANFIAFPPFKTVLVTMLGVAVADKTGLFEALSKKFLLRIPPYLLTASVIFVGVMSNLASDAGIVFMPALGAALFAVVGRSPIVGIAAGYASAASGYFANLMITSHDANLSGISLSVMDIVPITASAPMNVTVNWYMAIASTLVLVPVGTFVTDRIIEPKFGRLEGLNIVVNDSDRDVSPAEVKGLKAAGLALFVYLAAIAAMAIPENGWLRDMETGKSMLTQMDPIIPIIALAFFIVGTGYGFASGKLKSEKDVIKCMTEGMKSMGGFLVIAFAASQLIGIFKKTNLATVLAIVGSEGLEASGINGVPLIVIFILFLAFINLFLYSGSSKWALLAPVFIPMFGLLGFSPAFTMALYRIADSCTNIISPLFPYLPIVLGLTIQYKKDAGMGTIMSMMVPYSIAFTVSWIILAVVWYLLKIPVGPGAGVLL